MKRRRSGLQLSNPHLPTLMPGLREDNFHPTDIPPALFSIHGGLHSSHSACVLDDLRLFMSPPTTAVLREACIWEVNGNGAVLSRGRLFGDAADYTQGKSHKDDPDDPSFGESNLRQKVVASSDKQLYGSTIIPWRSGCENRITFPQTFFLAFALAMRLYCPQRLAG